MSEPAAPRHFPPMAGQTYQLGPMTLAFKPCEAEVDGFAERVKGGDGLDTAVSLVVG